ncbi:MAG: hypothetical protein V7752_07180 [Halopseudomonas sp.]
MTKLVTTIGGMVISPNRYLWSNCNNQYRVELEFRNDVCEEIALLIQDEIISESAKVICDEEGIDGISREQHAYGECYISLNGFPKGIESIKKFQNVMVSAVRRIAKRRDKYSNHVIGCGYFLTINTVCCTPDIVDSFISRTVLVNGEWHDT